MTPDEREKCETCDGQGYVIEIVLYSSEELSKMTEMPKKGIIKSDSASFVCPDCNGRGYV